MNQEAGQVMYYRIHKELGFLVTTWTGKVTNEDLINSYTRIFTDKNWSNQYNELADFREADAAKVTNNGLRKLVELAVKYEGDKKSAILVSHDLTYGLARMYEILSEQSPETVQVFRSAEKALNWLDAPSDLLDKH